MPRFVATTATTDTALHPVAKNVRESGAGPAAVAFAIVALLFVVAFFVYAVVLAAGTVVAALMWTLLFAFFPVLYLIAAIKVARSNKN